MPIPSLAALQHTQSSRYSQRLSSQMQINELDILIRSSGNTFAALLSGVHIMQQFEMC